MSASSNSRLDSWKEIAAYLNKGARTVQRWEKTEDLPIHRHMHDRQGTVYAFKDEIDAWWGTRRARLEKEETSVPNERVVRSPSAAVAVGCAILAFATGSYWASSSRSVTAVSTLSTPLTSFPGHESQAAFSPDGKQIAFVWSDRQGREADIYVQPLAGGVPTRITSDPRFDLYPAWSPDGQQLAFIRSGRDAPAEIVVRSIPSGAERVIASMKFGGGPGPVLCWSAGGRWLFLVERQEKDPAATIYRVAPHSGEKTRVLRLPAQAFGDTGIALSPDGRKLAFVRGESFSKRDIWLVNLNEESLAAGPPRRITQTNGLCGAPNWLRGGRDLYFALFRDYDSSWFRVSIQGLSQPRPFPELAAFQPAVAISPDGSRLVYPRNQTDHNIWRVPLDAAEPETPLIASTRIDTNPHVSPDGQYIVFPSDRNGTMDIWKCNRSGGETIRLTAMPGKSSGTPRWSPDGKRILFDVGDGANVDLWVMAADGGQQRRLTTDPARDFVPNWSRDGEWIYFGSTRSGVPQIWKMPSNGGDASQVTTNGGYAALASHDDKALFLTKFNAKGQGEQGLWRFDLASGTEKKLLDAVVDWSRFAVFEDGIYYIVCSGDNSSILYFYDFRSGQSRKIRALSKPALMGFSVSPDRKWAIYSALEHSDSDLILVENFH